MSGENDSVQPAATFEKCSVVLVDVLGTTTSINFAKETLFPFVTKNVEEILKAKWDDDSVKSAAKQLKEGDEEIDLEAAVKLVKELTESGSENAGLKTIQGIVYAKGYENGELKSHVFEDVPKAFETWAKSRKVAVYSTGSVDSQKQLFSNSIEGDLTAHISKYFDQSVGPKSEADSYKKIVEELAVKPEEVLFVTDQIEEAKAAKSAGLSAAIITREGNAKLAEDSKGFFVISSFKDVSFENPSKRKNTDEPAVTEEPPSKVAKTEDEKAQIQEKKTEEKAESIEKVEDEAMEVDAPVEVLKAESKEEEKCDTKVDTTEKTEATTKKTEEKPVEEDVTMADSTVNEKKDAETKAKTEEKTEVKAETGKTEEKDTSDKKAADVKEADDKKTVTDSSDSKRNEVKVEEKKIVLDDAKAEKSEEEDKVDSTSKEVDAKETDKVNNEVQVTIEKKDDDKVEETPGKKDTEIKMGCATEKEAAEKNDAKSANEVEKSEVKPSKPESEKPKETKTDNEVTSSEQKTEETPAEKVKESSTKEAKDLSTGKVEIEEKSTKPDEEEKENQKDLANGVENGDKDGVDSKTTNGGTSEKAAVNGNADEKEEANGTAEESNDTPVETVVDEIKVKKVEAPAAAPTDAPTVSVEV